MILVDTSVWIDHLNKADSHLEHLLNKSQVIIHPFVIGEIALGKLRKRIELLGSFMGLAVATLVKEDDVLSAIGLMQLDGTGIGYVDAHLLVSTKLDGLKLWTRDKRLAAQAERLSTRYNTMQ